MRIHRPNPSIPPMRLHQKEALEFAENKPDPSYFGLLMEPGTGKTKTMFEKLAKLYLDREIETALILAPNGVAAQWIEEQAPEHCPIPYRAVLWSPARTKRWKDETRYTLRKRDALLLFALNWEALTTKDGINLCNWMLKNRKTALVADESSRIRNPNAIRTKEALQLAPLAEFRSILTGTPVTKGFENLWAQMQFLSPDILQCKTYHQFRAHYCKLKSVPGRRGAVMITGYQRTSELMSRISPHVFIKTKDECLDLPPKLPLPSPVPLTPEQAIAYRTMRELLIVELENLERVTVAHMIAARSKLRQIAIGFIMDKERKVSTFPSGRWDRTLEHLEDANGKVILWTSFRYCLARWEEILTKNKIGYVRYLKGDNESIRYWKRDRDIKVFLGNPHSGGIGLNLAEASTMIYFNSTDDFEVRLQSEDRAHRIGQFNSLTIVDLFAPKTVEVKMQQQQMEKQTLLDVVMTKGWRAAL